nr:hypothetical protein [Paraglaciecola polaris]
MPPGFTTSFAKRLNDCCKVAVKKLSTTSAFCPVLYIWRRGRCI